MSTIRIEQHNEKNKGKQQRLAYMLGLMSFIAFFILFEIVANQEAVPTWATVYLALYVVVIALIMLSKIAPNMIEYRLYGNLTKSLDTYIMLGLVLFVIFGIIKAGYIFQALIPATVTSSLGGLTNSIFIEAVVLVAIAPIFEEVLFRGIIFPTLMNIIRTKYALSIIFLVFSLVSVYEGSLLLAGVLLGIAMLFAFYKKAIFLFDDSLHTFLMAMFTSAFMFAIYHVYAYGGASDINAVLGELFIFGCIAVLIDQFVGKSVVPSILLHSANNALALAAIMSGTLIPALIVFVIVTVAMFIGIGSKQIAVVRNQGMDYMFR